MPICKKCGAEIPDEYKFCGKCGTPVKSAHEDVQNGTANNPYGNPSANQGAENPYGNRNGNPYGNPNGNPNGNPYGNPNGNPNGNPYGNPNGNPNGNPYGSPYGNPYTPYGSPYGNPYDPNLPSGRFSVGLLILAIIEFFFFGWIAVWPFYHLLQARSAPSRYAEEDHLKKARRALLIVFLIFFVGFVLLIFSVALLSMIQ